MAAVALRPRPQPTQVPVSGLALDVARRIDGLLQGDHRGLLPGHGSESGDARPYVPGDDPRRIDWPVTARTNETHVRDTVADHELELWLVVDTSASLSFGTAEHTKGELAWAVAGALAMLAARGGNRIGAVAAASSPTIVPARSGRAHLSHLLARLDAARAAGDAGNLATALTSVRRLAKRRGLVVVVSDFLERGWQQPLTYVAARHEVIAVEVVDRRELSLADVGWLTVVDPETRRRRHVDTRDARLRRRYAEAAAAQRAAIAAALVEAGADHVVLRTDGDWAGELARFVSRRRAWRTAAKGVQRA